ncbi:LNS2 (Lipin/Ned1/Smp2) protein, partial [Toxoplasma gondii VAND]
NTFPYVCRKCCGRPRGKPTQRVRNRICNDLLTFLGHPLKSESRSRCSTGDCFSWVSTGFFSGSTVHVEVNFPVFSLMLCVGSAAVVQIRPLNRAESAVFCWAGCLLFAIEWEAAQARVEKFIWPFIPNDCVFFPSLILVHALCIKVKVDTFIIAVFQSSFLAVLSASTCASLNEHFKLY